MSQTTRTMNTGPVADRVPTEFQYFKNVHSPAVRRRIKWMKRVLRFDPLLPDETVRTWAKTYYDADQVAEAFVDEVYLKQGQKAGRAMVDQALEKGVDSIEDAPQTLRTL